MVEVRGSGGQGALRGRHEGGNRKEASESVSTPEQWGATEGSVQREWQGLISTGDGWPEGAVDTPESASGLQAGPPVCTALLGTAVAGPQGVGRSDGRCPVCPARRPPRLHAPAPPLLPSARPHTQSGWQVRATQETLTRGMTVGV